jgi:hypothetical protein
VLIFVDVLVDPKGMSQDELWDAWEEEANAALAAKEAETVVSLYKVCGQRRVWRSWMSSPSTSSTRSGWPSCRWPATWS